MREPKVNELWTDQQGRSAVILEVTWCVTLLYDDDDLPETLTMHSFLTEFHE